MKIMKIAIILAASALTTSPAWALPGNAPSNLGSERAPSTVPAGPPSTTPNDTDNPGSVNRSATGQENAGGGEHSSSHDGSANDGSDDKGSDRGPHHSGRPSHPGHSHRCTPHNVAYVAAGTLLGQTLSRDASANTYSGELEVAVKHANHHAAGDRNTTKTYKAEHVRITFALSDVNNDGSVGLDDVQANDQVRLIGRVTSLSKYCDQTGFTPTLTLEHIALHPAARS
jgi:hypothetical protein